MGDFESVSSQIEGLLNSIYVKSQTQGLTKSSKINFFTDGPVICDLNLPASGTVLGTRLAGAGTKESLMEFELSYIKKLSNDPNQYYFAQLSANESGFDFTERSVLVDPERRIGKTLDDEILAARLNTYQDAAPILEEDLIPYLEDIQNISYTNQPSEDFALIRDVLASDKVLE